MDKIEKIRAEIERRWKDYRNSVTPDQPKYRTHYFVGKGEVCEELLSFLDTLEEPDKCKGCNNVKGCIACVDGDQWAHYEEPVCEELNEAAKAYTDARDWAKENYLTPYIRQAFKAGANWQKTHDAELIEIAYNDGITIGKTKQKEQMGEQARQALAKTDITLADLVAFDEGCTIGRRLERQQMLKDAVEGKVYFQMGGIKRVKSDDFENPDIHLGDKVKLIIVKEDEE